MDYILAEKEKETNKILTMECEKAKKNFQYLDVKIKIDEKFKDLTFSDKNQFQFIDIQDQLQINDVEELQKYSKFLLEREINPILKHLITEKIEENSTFYITDLSKLIIQHLKWMKNFPTIRPFYAVKSNNDLQIIKKLGDLGCGFDCASQEEIKQVLCLGISPLSIIYSHPIKLPSHLKYAYKNGVNKMIIDCIEEIDKIKENHPNAELVIRIAVDDSKSRSEMSFKFGIDSENTRKLIERCYELQMKLIGVSFHIGTLSRDPNAFFSAIEKSRKIFDEAQEFNYKLDFLDIGGGFPGVDGDYKLEDFAKSANDSINHFFSDLKVNVIAEPGRFYSTSVSSLVVNIFGKKAKKKTNIEPDKINERDTSESINYYINNGIHGSFTNYKKENWEIKISGFFVWDSDSNDYKFIDIDKKDFREKTYLSIVFGPSCDPGDFIFKNVRLPELNMGDWMIFHNFGSYNQTAGYDFNGFLKPKTLYLNSRISSELEQKIAEFYRKI